MKKEMTLCYFINGEQILLPLKKKKIGKGKYNGVGGRLEDNESPEEAMIRECIEEVGLKPTEYSLVAELYFNDDGIVYTYLCNSWEGKLIETDEMKPFWFDINNIPFDNMMDDDKHWLPFVLKGKKIRAFFELDENYITLNHHIEEVKVLEKKG